MNQPVAYAELIAAFKRADSGRSAGDSFAKKLAHQGVGLKD